MQCVSEIPFSFRHLSAQLIENLKCSIDLQRALEQGLIGRAVGFRAEPQVCEPPVRFGYRITCRTDVGLGDRLIFLGKLACDGVGCG